MHFSSIFMCDSLVFFGLLFSSVHSQSSSVNSLTRSKRFLIFPPTAPTRLQFIGGIGIPVEDLNFESVTSGYVLKAEYFLPETAESLRPSPIRPQNITTRSLGQQFSNRSLSNMLYGDEQYVDGDDDVGMGNSKQMHSSSSSSDSSSNLRSQHKNAAIYRWIIYKGIEAVLNSSGLPGHICLLRSICEHAALPLHYESGLLAEILHIILTPTTSADNDLLVDHGNGSGVGSTSKAYLLAEQLGHNNGIMCAHNYGACSQSPIDQITAVFNIE